MDDHITTAQYDQTFFTVRHEIVGLKERFNLAPGYVIFVRSESTGDDVQRSLLLLVSSVIDYTIIVYVPEGEY